MAGKEMLIVFLYNTELKTEEDDPLSALLFFAPSWVGETQKLALVGQIMGVSRFFQDNFGSAKIITLQSGKFALRRFRRFVLAVGTDRNVAESILLHRSELLSSLIQLYHKDVENISGSFLRGQEYDKKSDEDQQQTKHFTDKLYHIFNTYLPILQYNGNIFNNIVLLDLPKSASNIYLDVVQILQSCQQQSGVLGGQILYHNKVIASQLPSDLAKLLVISDPFRLKTTESISVDFHVPSGLQLITIYISSKDYNNMRNSSHKAQISFLNSNNPNLLPFTLKKKQVSKDILVSGMKRDKSLIFTNIPEEDVCHNENKQKTKLKNRPTHLPLKFKNATTKELPESGFSSINFDEFSDSFPEFIGRTSVCSTPMTENKILHGNILSICSNKCEELERIDVQVEAKPPLSIISSENLKSSKEISSNEQVPKKSRKVMGTPRKIKLTPKVTEVISIDIDQEQEVSNQNNKKLYEKNVVNLPIDSCNYMNNPHKIHKRSNSWDSFNNKRSQLKTCKKNETESDIYKDTDSDSEFIDDCEKRPSRSITDPTFPVFNATGDPITRNLFEELLDFHYSQICSANTKEFQKNKHKEFDILEIEELSDKIEINKKAATNKQVEEKIKMNVEEHESKLKKTGLSLPLKSWNPSTEFDNESGKISSNIFESSSSRNRGLQLTPLMAKLTILAMDGEIHRGFDVDCEQTTESDLTSMLKKCRKSDTKDDIDTKKKLDIDTKMEKVDLFVCGQQNMTLIIILEPGSVQRQNLIQTLFEICVSKLTKIEAQLHQVLNMNVEGADKGGEGNYSFITIDNKKWDTVQKAGPWSPNELITIESMHTDMKRNPNFTDMILRKHEHILYGYQCGDLEVFYQQSHNNSAGLPPPSDVLGSVGSVVRRRLERDRAIVLL
uniref:CSON006812 protein n=1 Tax=Culicoides sonorensis TaxID=179676 RepID=A0A336M0T0_CULSO